MRERREKSLRDFCVNAGSYPCASSYPGGIRCEPRTVRAVRCAWGGVASGTDCRGVMRAMSIVLKGFLAGLIHLRYLLGDAKQIFCTWFEYMVRQAVRVLLGRRPLTATAYPLRVHHERPFDTKAHHEQPFDTRLGSASNSTRIKFSRYY